MTEPDVTAAQWMAQVARACALEPGRILAGSSGAVTFEARRDGDAVIVKVASQPLGLAREVGVLSLLDGRCPLVPRLIDAGTLGAQTYFIQHRLPGTNLASLEELGTDDDRRRACHSMGAALSIVQHCADGPELLAGRFWRHNTDLGIEYPGWAPYVELQARKWRSRLRLTEADDRTGVSTAVAEVFRLLAETELDDRLDLIHGDYTTRNVLFEPGGQRVSGIVDYETAMIGDGLYDLGKTVWLDMPIDDEDARRALAQGWESTSQRVASDRLLAVYAGVQCLAAMAWCDVRQGAAGAADFRARAAGVLRHLSERHWRL
jgi:aminoglycoside phosphotransferase (APT) family kinase protein